MPYEQMGEFSPDDEQDDSASPEVKKLRAMVVEAIRQRDALQEQLDNGGLTTDLVEYEQQLNQFREQLEVAQERLMEKKEEIKKLEIELSQERARIGRDKTSVEQMLSEIDAKLEQLTRHEALTNQYADLQKLRNDMRGSAPGAAPTGGETQGKLPGFAAKLRKILRSGE